MKFYHSLGYLVFGSRLRRMSELFLADVNKIYQSLNIDFDASWFPVFYILSKQREASIREIADELNVSHSAISQLTSSLRQKGLLEIRPSITDARKKVVCFSDDGQQLLRQIKPVWETLSEVMEAMAAERKHSRHILAAIGELEDSMGSESLFNRVESRLS